MAWHGSGEDRIKRFRLYQELESRYEEAVREQDELRARIAAKDDTIRHLAMELAGMADKGPVEIGPDTSTRIEGTLEQAVAAVSKAPTMPPASGPGIKKVVAPATRPPPTKSGQMAIRDIMHQLAQRKSVSSGKT